MDFGVLQAAFEQKDQAVQAGYTKESEQIAKQMGFRNADAMIQFEKQKMMHRGVTTVAGEGGAKVDPKPAPRDMDNRSFVQKIYDAFTTGLGSSK